MGTVNLGQVAALIQSVAAEPLLEGATPTVRNVGTKSNAQLIFGLPAIESDLKRIMRKTPKNITQYFTDDTFYKRLAGTDGFVLCEDIHIGDYFEMSRAITCPNSYSGEVGTQWCTIADIDAFMGRGDTPIDYHHAIIVPGKSNDTSEIQHFGRARMNPTDSTTGAYKACEMNTTTLGSVVSAGSTASGATINQQLYAEFGDHLKTTREVISNSINASGYNRFGTANGCSNNWEWVSVQSILMSEIEVYGSIVWSSSGYDTGSACKPLALFQQSEIARNNRTAYYWLKDVASSAWFCYSSSVGYAYYDNASVASDYVRPRFIIA